MQQKTAVVWGYFLQNLGDDLMLKAFLKAAEGRYQKIYINSYRSYEAYYSGLGVTAVAQDSFVQRAANKILRTLRLPQLYFRLAKGKNTDFIILGGSVFIEAPTEEENAQRLRDLEYARCHADKTYVIGSNFGPFVSPRFYDKYRAFFSKCTDVCFRDFYSRDLFPDLKNVRYAPDVVLSGLWDSERDSAPEKNTVLISVMNLEKRPRLKAVLPAYEKTLAELVGYHVAQGDRVVLAAFCEADGDTEACARIQKLCGGKNVEILPYRDGTILAAISGAKKIYASRFHAVILALYYGTACVPFIYDEKTTNAIRAYCGEMKSVDMLDLPAWEEIVGLNQCFTLGPDMQELAKGQFAGFSAAGKE